MTDNRLTLFCLVDGETTSNAFSVEIDPIKSVEHLKNLIKAKKAPRFDDAISVFAIFNEVQLSPDILRQLQALFQEINPIAQSFKNILQREGGLPPRELSSVPTERLACQDNHAVPDEEDLSTVNIGISDINPAIALET
ncbi:hypothetical protein BGZ94_007051 [Podila epigama]|nr:hypothetical protein BGZ94_007051 [Podila epigama]